MSRNMTLKNMCNERWERSKWEKGIGDHIIAKLKLRHIKAVTFTMFHVLDVHQF